MLAVNFATGFVNDVNSQVWIATRLLSSHPGRQNPSVFDCHTITRQFDAGLVSNRNAIFQVKIVGTHQSVPAIGSLDLRNHARVKKVPPKVLGANLGGDLGT